MSELDPAGGGTVGALAPPEALDSGALTGRVLVVDDTPFNRQLLIRLLTRIGHESLEAGDGRAALAILRDPATPPVDVILTDIVMPGVGASRCWTARACSIRARRSFS